MEQHKSQCRHTQKGKERRNRAMDLWLESCSPFLEGAVLDQKNHVRWRAEVRFASSPRCTVVPEVFYFFFIAVSHINFVAYISFAEGFQILLAVKILL